MLKEKLSQILKSDGNNKKKTENLVFLLIILIITVIAINVIWKEDNTSNSNDITNTAKKLAITEEKSNEGNLEKKLENILSKINGVGNVEVLITYNETEEIIPIYNTKDKTSITNETDSGGGTRVIQENDKSQEVIYQNDEIIVQKTINPKIEGAIIVASGANNSSVKASIIQAVEAATGLATHKIQVFEEQN